ncbi:hypothetical protein SS1G_01882 [Sclerotinia sclerotiorum 1980 UF-70]|uniref:cutinase n=1 Tax=Sclerotinia sclerotiorum (strain ATCC 18683 / 1980 / Ss-1) TaxID=665079 RepID=A7E9A2_SCLS1|nr:hypothetical protein SS1G_01882 [Sclerotinia sclerotiorum 1980 UF-70]EDN96954.1 hypothetical protein SS1G_01882 [Sclerotinia sclerotiorum 1980 UF-70]
MSCIHRGGCSREAQRKDDPDGRVIGGYTYMKGIFSTHVELASMRNADSQTSFVTALICKYQKDDLTHNFKLTLKTFLGNKGNVITQNDVLDSNGSCATMTVLFARGTGEVGNVGLLTGPPFFTALAAYMNQTGSMAIQGVDYAASVSGFLSGGDPAGAKTMCGWPYK